MAVYCGDTGGRAPLSSWNSITPYCEWKMEAWVRSAFQARTMTENDQFKLEPTKLVVMDKQTGLEEKSMQWSNGLSQCLQARHCSHHVLPPLLQDLPPCSLPLPPLLQDLPPCSLSTLALLHACLCADSHAPRHRCREPKGDLRLE